MPAVERFCKKTGIPPSKLMIPLSYAAIVGNYSIIATSPNLVVIAIAQRLDPTLDFPFFQPGIIGIPIMVTAWIYMFTLGATLLPTRKSPLIDYSKNSKEYTLTVTVSKSSPIVGKTVEEAGLRHLEGLFLVEVSSVLSLVVFYVTYDLIRKSTAGAKKRAVASCSWFCHYHHRW